MHNKREQILRSAIKVLSEKGLEKTKISDITKDAGIAQGTFYIYFSSKNALIPAIADSMLQNFLNTVNTRLNEGMTFFEQLETMIDITFDVTSKYKDVLALCYSGLAINGALNDWEKIYEPYYKLLEKKIVSAQARDEIRKDLNSKIITKLLIELVEGAAEQVYLFEEDKNLTEEYQKELISFIKHSFL